MSKYKPSIKILHKKHKQMWDELSKTGGRDKTETKAYKHAVRYHYLYNKAVFTACFACQTTNVCANCQVLWGTDNCLRSASAYTDWKWARTDKERKHFAAIIRDLPWRYENV